MLIFALSLWIYTIIRWVNGEDKFESWNVLIAAIISTLLSAFSFFQSSEKYSIENSEFYKKKLISKYEKDASKLKKRVENSWIRNYLYKSLPENVLANQNLNYKANKLEFKEMVKNYSAPKSLKDTAELINSLDNVFGTTLIIGEPGSGKTTLLLTILNNVIKNSKAKIPIYITLNTYDEKPFYDYLSNEISYRYGINENSIRYLLDTKQICPFVDGIDEINKKTTRMKCIKAINEFILEHYHGENIYITSRQNEYRELKYKIKAKQVLGLKRLKSSQVDNYLEKLISNNLKLSALKKHINESSVFQELSRIPLFLNTMILTYEGVKKIKKKKKSILKKELFKNYIIKMFERRKNESSYRLESIVDYLFNFSKILTEHKIKQFELEHIQPKMLSTEKQIKSYNTYSSMACIFIPLLIVSLCMLATNSVSFKVLLTLGLMIMFVDTLIKTLLPLKLRSIQFTERLDFSFLRGLNQSLISAAIGGILVLPLEYLQTGTLSFQRFIATSAIGAFFGLIFGGLKKIPVTNKENFGQGVINSIKNGFAVCLLSGLIVGSITSIVLITNTLDFELSDAVLTTCIVVIAVGFFYGIGAVVSHICLRKVLSDHKVLPLKIGELFDSFENLIFTYRIGGSHVLMHRSFQEYLSQISQEELLKLKDEVTMPNNI